MTYTVVWRPFAERTLIELWTDTEDRQLVTDAANTIDSLLRSDPVDVGESRSDDSRFLYVSPLAVYYDVFPDDRRVAVWAVWRHPK
jgi:plasmid stabilization system protein ParE